MHNTKYSTGYARRDRLEMQVLRGFDPVGHSNLTHTAPIKETERGLIRSGMLISLEDNGGVLEWVRGCPKGSEPFWALNDDEPGRTRSPNGFTALSGYGVYEISTGYFNEGAGNYNNGAAIIADSVNPGFVTLGDLSDASADILARVSRAGVGDEGIESGRRPVVNDAIYTKFITFRTAGSPSRT